MNRWGIRTWGEPCRECGFSWSLSCENGVAVMAGIPARFREAVGFSDGTSVGLGLNWSVTAYVCHVADNLRIFAERLVGVAHGGGPRIAAYDQDDLADARNYAGVAIQGALWSLERAVADWLAAIDVARAAEVVFEHPERRRYTWADVVSSNLHDAVREVTMSSTSVGPFDAAMRTTVADHVTPRGRIDGGASSRHLGDASSQRTDTALNNAIATCLDRPACGFYGTSGLSSSSVRRAVSG